ncbi:hypothetical protein [Rhodopseudomonas sp. RCAM05734]|uniref:hypothetical protein n=1 Tax=Rhodopseudomonas sp. RCAM05734 TaxID=3457549 RepID=UPI00404504B7
MVVKSQVTVVPGAGVGAVAAGVHAACASVAIETDTPNAKAAPAALRIHSCPRPNCMFVPVTSTPWRISGWEFNTGPGHLHNQKSVLRGKRQFASN